MTCQNCQAECKRFGKDRKGNQRFRCRQCGKTYQEARDNTLNGMYTPIDKAVQVLQLFVEGMTVSSIERITGLHHKTILSLLTLAGEKCERLSERLIRNVPVDDLQADELWGFIQKKEAHKRPEEANDDSIGDTWTFACIERNSKLIVAWHQGRRSFIDDPASTE